MLWVILILALILLLGFGGLALFVARAFLIVALVVLLVGLILGAWLFRGNRGGVRMRD